MKFIKVKNYNYQHVTGHNEKVEGYHDEGITNLNLDKVYTVSELNEDGYAWVRLAEDRSGFYVDKAGYNKIMKAIK